MRGTEQKLKVVLYQCFVFFPDVEVTFQRENVTLDYADKTTVLQMVKAFRDKGAITAAQAAKIQNAGDINLKDMKKALRDLMRNSTASKMQLFVTLMKQHEVFTTAYKPGT